MTNPLILLVTLAAAMMPTVGVSGSLDLNGYWLTQNGRGIVRFAPCAEEGNFVCGHMAWVAEPRNPDGALKRDVNNPDESLRERALCNLQLIGDLKPGGHNLWQDGWVYNPRNGKRYSVKIRVTSEAELVMRGFLGIELFGKNQIWTRVENDREGCPAA